jgi:hypothetical protein
MIIIYKIIIGLYPVLYRCKSGLALKNTNLGFLRTVLRKIFEPIQPERKLKNIQKITKYGAS